MVVDDDPLDGNGLPEWSCFWCGFSLRPAFWGGVFKGHPEQFTMKPMPDWEGEINVDDIEAVEEGRLF